MGSSTLKILGLFLLFIFIISVTVFGLFQNVHIGSQGQGLSEDDVKKIVKEYIDNNGDAILQSVASYQERSQHEQDKAAKENAFKMKDNLEDSPTSPVAGNKNGDVTLVEFFDYSCGYCKKVFPSIAKLLEEDKNLKIVFKEFPILGPNSYVASKAALAVNAIDPSKYMDFHKKLMESGRVPNKDGILKIAANMGLNADDVSKKMDSDEIQAIIDNDKIIASQIGIRGTPAFIINGELIPGAIDLEEFRMKIAAARESKAPMAQPESMPEQESEPAPQTN